MTAENQALLDAIRLIVGEAVAPLATRFDGLNDRVDGLNVRVDGLNDRVDGLNDRVDGLNDRVDGLSTRFDDLSTRFDDLSTRFDGMSIRMDGLFEHVGGLTEQMTVVVDRIDRIEVEQRTQRELLQAMDLRLVTLEGIARRLETEIETIETRTSQMSSDVRDVLDQQEQANKWLRTLRREVEHTIVQVEVLEDNQQGYQQQLRQLQERVDSLERRMIKLESPEGTA